MFRAIVSALLLSWVVLIGFAWSAPDCGSCYVKESALQKLQTAEQEYLDLLKKNSDYLAKLGPSDSSKAVKLRSNITMLNINLDGLRNNILDLSLELSRQCTQCKTDETENGVSHEQ